MPFGGPFISHEEVFGRRSNLAEIKDILSELDLVASLTFLEKTHWMRR